MMVGSGVHAFIEKANEGNAEMLLRQIIDGLDVGTRTDWYDGDTLIDWKTTALYSVTMIKRNGLEAEKPEWVRQLDLMRGMLALSGKKDPRICAIATIAKDWRSAEAKKTRDYPAALELFPVQTL